MGVYPESLLVVCKRNVGVHPQNLPKVLDFCGSLSCGWYKGMWEFIPRATFTDLRFVGVPSKR
jgi:hypothetical protein